MARSDNIARLAILGFNGCSAWITAGILEFFALANAVAHARGLPQRIQCHLVSSRSRSISGSQGVRFAARGAQGRYDALIVPPLWSSSRAEFESSLQANRKQLPFLLQLAKRSALVTSACSGAVLLAEAGLLNSYRVTTCWWLADWFAARHPEVELDVGKLVVTDRDRCTAAAGTAYLHLCLQLVRRFAGSQIALAAGRLALVEPRRGSQSPFLPEAAQDIEADASIRAAAQLIERQLAKPLNVATLARQLGTTARTLHRRFRRALDVSPLQYLQSRRIARAKQLLSASRASVEQVVERCGYSDVASFRKLFAREVGMTPREYRSRFAQGS